MYFPLVQNTVLFCFFFKHTLYFSKTCLVPGIILDTLTSTLTLCLHNWQAKLLIYYTVSTQNTRHHGYTT